MTGHSLTASRPTHLTYPELRLKDNLLDDIPRVKKFTSNYGSFQLHNAPTTNIGALSRLPLELLQEVIYHLDIETLVGFRRVNREVFAVLGSVPAYRAIAKHARNALCGILAIGTGRWITCGTFYEKLSTSECETCGDFGGYLYLLTCKRVCFLCLSRDPLYLPLRPGHARRKFGLKTVNRSPCMRVIPGLYSPNEKKVSRCVLVDYESTRSAGIEAHGSASAMDKFVLDLETQKLEEFEARKAEAHASEGGQSHVRRPPMHDPYDGQSSNPLRFVAVARVAYLSTTSQELHWGFHCVGCERSSRPPLHYRRKFTAASFQDHLLQCGDIMNGAHHLN
ncbi:hypothetical protein F4808DRAFT_398638 [Astrocystis sublimbata]|nr:hypothetical protein F4808DRAFT_398638 [Astrocystis sublimbata]